VKSFAAVADTSATPPQQRIVEVVVETARAVLRAASLTLNRRESPDVVRSLINVGDLGPGEVRWPTDETYPLSRFPESGHFLTARRSAT
jgi:hypothetical protein